MKKGFSDYQNILENVFNLDFSKQTEMCHLFTSYGNDKGKIGKHNYTILYDQLFYSLRKEKLKLFELGIGNIFHMGPGYIGSLHAWSCYFPNSIIYGADIDTSSLFQTSTIQTYEVNSLDKKSIKKLWVACI